MKIILPSLIFNIERWKWNKEYRIYVSNQGHFKDEHKQNICINITSSGYASIKTLYGFKLAHRLVMMTWRPIPNAESLTIDHLNHNKRDNCLRNLEWVSKRENQERAKRDIINTIKIYMGDKVFLSFRQAADYVNKNKLEKRISKETIRKKIKKAIERNTEYVGEKWRIEVIKVEK